MTTKRKPVLAGVGLYIKLAISDSDNKPEIVLFPKGETYLGDQVTYGFVYRTGRFNNRWSLGSKIGFDYISGYRKVIAEDLKNENFVPTEQAVDKANEKVVVRDKVRRVNSIQKGDEPENFIEGLVRGIIEEIADLHEFRYFYNNSNIQISVDTVQAVDVTDTDLKVFFNDDKLSEPLKNRIKKINEALEERKAQSSIPSV